MTRENAEKLLKNGVCLTSDKGTLSLVVKQLEDGTYLLVTIDSDRKRANTQTTETCDAALAMMEEFTPWENWEVPEV